MLGSVSAPRPEPVNEVDRPYRLQRRRARCEPEASRRGTPKMPVMKRRVTERHPKALRIDRGWTDRGCETLRARLSELPSDGQPASQSRWDVFGELATEQGPAGLESSASSLEPRQRG